MVKEYLGIVIDTARDSNLQEQARAMLTRKGFYKKEHEESPQETFARAATSYCFGDYKLAQRLYDACSSEWFTWASPVQTNALDIDWPTFDRHQFQEAGDWLEENVTPEGMPISCFLSMIPDSRHGLVQTREETAWLSMMGGGIGVGAFNRSPDEKSTGVMAHLRGYDADALSYRQTASRRGSIAAYMDIDHPEIMPFIQMREPTGGDPNKKCFNLNNAVNIPDSFMHAMIAGEKYELKDPKHGPTGNFLDAREVWEHLMKARDETGEPYVNFIDTVNRNIPEHITMGTYHVRQSNLCVAPETLVLTDNGNIQIQDLEGQEVNVWNGEEFSKAEVVKTGTDQKLIKVVTHHGQELECTEYHKFYVKNEYHKPAAMVRAKDLKEGDKLIKFDLPVVEGQEPLSKAYTNGFYTGDGCYYEGKAIIYLYNEKRDLIDHIEFDGTWNEYGERLSARNVKGLKSKYFVPSESYDMQSRLSWLEGFCDADGTIARNDGNEALQMGSTNKQFLLELQLMLQTLGIRSALNFAMEAGERMLPMNDGSGDSKLYPCKDAWRLLVSSHELWKLRELGFSPKRLKMLSTEPPQRDAGRFNTVTAVLDEGRVSDTYCFTEPKRSMGMFGGLLTGNCNEIHLMTSKERTAVCCLSSLNLEKYDEWKNTTLVADLLRVLDNVLEFFIRLAPPQLKRAVYSAQRERAVGIGTLGWHSYLQSKDIPFESGGVGSASQLSNTIYKRIKEQAAEASRAMAGYRGEPDDLIGSGYRNSHFLAIAPNASSSSLVGASPSIEAWAANAFNAQGRAGSFLIKNKHLKQVLEDYDQDTSEVWKSIVENDGSVQHLGFLSDHHKLVYKTAKEINPMWVVELASIRQQHICQGQSVNLHSDGTWTKQEISDVHFQAWKKGLKGLYYLRNEAATKASVGTGGEQPLNAVAVRSKIEYTTCLSCEG